MEQCVRSLQGVAEIQHYRNPNAVQALSFSLKTQLDRGRSLAAHSLRVCLGSKRCKLSFLQAIAKVGMRTCGFELKEVQDGTMSGNVN
jgi:hypothetical protein